MAKTKIEKIATIEEEIRQLKERQKQLQQQHNAQERKDRTRRLCKRAGLLESLLPDSIPLTDEQFKTFLEKTITTEHSRRILDGLTAQNAAKVAPIPAEAAARDKPTPAAKATDTARESGGNGGADGSNGARVTG
jgi:hypothetical protein